MSAFTCCSSKVRRSPLGSLFTNGTRMPNADVYDSRAASSLRS